MMRTELLLLAFGTLALGACAGTEPDSGEPDSGEPTPELPGPPDPRGSWPQFRGTGASGVAEGFALPLSFDVESGENVRWKTPVPGLAHSSPVVWGDRLWVTTAVAEEEPRLELRGQDDNRSRSVEGEGPSRFLLYCLDRRDGSVLWTALAHEGVPRVKRHLRGSHANSSPATDGRRVLAHFGSEGLYCYDTGGRLLWSRDLGLLDSGYWRVGEEDLATSQWGFASSPVIHEGVAYLQCDVRNGSHLLALDAATGTELWRAERDEVPTWGTPTVDVRPGRRQLVVNGFRNVGGYDLATGAELWSLNGGGDIPVPTPIVSGDLVYVTSWHGRWAPVLAIDALATGELTLIADDHPEVVWGYTRGGAYIQTPLVYGEHLYVGMDGVVSCYVASTGEKVYRKRLGIGASSSSAVAGDGKIYYANHAGTVFVLRPGPEFEVLAESELAETTLATPAISEGSLYFRTRAHVIAIGAGRAAPTGP